MGAEMRAGYENDNSDGAKLIKTLTIKKTLINNNDFPAECKIEPVEYSNHGIADPHGT